MRFKRTAAALASLASLVLAWTAPGRAEEPPAVQVFDTGGAGLVPLSSEQVLRRPGWTRLAEDETDIQARGDLVLCNNRLAVVFRQRGRGAEVYALGPASAVQRAELVPLGHAPCSALARVKLVENNSGTASVDATFTTESGELVTIGCELRVGQVFVETTPRPGTVGLRIFAPSRFAVLPDFFADDLVVDATQVSVAQAELPSENFLLHMVGAGDAIVAPVWHPAKDDVRIALSGNGASRQITCSEVNYAAGGKIAVAVLSEPGIWHLRQISPGDANQVVRLDWKAPFQAHWRVDWQRDDGLTDSWEMLSQKPTGEYVKHGWYGQPESFGNEDWLRTGRERWTTVLGFFLYPCWLNNQGEGFLQPLKKGVRFQGPALIYPINRLAETPLDAFTLVDVMRATLGIGPCEYVLDVEGQKKRFEGRPTCESRTILDDIYSRNQQKAQRDQVQKTLDEVIAFVRHIRGRIEDYAAFAHEMSAFFEAQKKAYPDLAEHLQSLQDLTGRIDQFIARRKNHIQTPEYATGLVDTFRAQLVDYEGDDALARCKRITAALVDIGGNQDELVGECRMVVKILRQRAALDMASDPRLAPVAKEVRVRTQRMLRNPTSYEAPRH